ncbi:aldo/keto reductase [Mariniblastus sp.]|jgi:L-galactose dehydrogenase|nr:aldo/keto reductase [Mariniblastus sp.]MDA7906317.1 aldo/keto reductase [Mariniblastus sp.]MDC3224932.1 aldo/keto reductase [Mariniblastus sp.]
MDWQNLTFKKQSDMEKRRLGKTDMDISVLSFGASSLGAEFRKIDLNEAVKSVHVALDHGMNFIDTSPYYGRGLSESLLGFALDGVPRDSYYLGTKLGRYAPSHFDFSAKRVRESVDISLERMRTDYLDIILCHDIEFVDMQQIWDETIPELYRLKKAGKVKHIGVSGYPMKIFREAAAHSEIDVILSYNHYTLQNTMLEDLVDEMQAKQIGIMNAAPFSARLLTNAPLPEWHKATDSVRETCKQAAQHCTAAGVDIAKLALQYSIANENMTTCITGSANPGRVAQWCEWLQEPLDQQLVKEVQDILAPVHNWFYVECLPENSDPI